MEEMEKRGEATQVVGDGEIMQCGDDDGREDKARGDKTLK